MGIDNVTDVTPRVQYTAIAAQVDFDYSFQIFEDADLVVEVDGVTKALTTDYTVSGATEDTGGTVTFLSAPGAGAVVTIYRDTAIARTSDFGQNGPILSSAVNDELDKVYLIAQELENKIGRAIRFPQDAGISNAQAELEPLSNYLDKFLHITSAGLLEPADALDNTVSLSASVIGGLLYPQTSAESAAGITPTDYSYPPGNVNRYGADPTGVSDSTAAFQNAHDVLLQTPGLFHVPDGTFLVKSFNWTASYCVIRCDGILKHASTTAGYVMQIGTGSTSAGTVFGLVGNLNFDSDTTGSDLANTISALKIVNMVNSNLTLNIEGFTYNLHIEPSYFVAYNNFYLGGMTNGHYGVYIRVTGATPAANRNNFFGGRFGINSGTTFNDQYGIYIDGTGATSVPNDNQFFSPSFETKAGAFVNVLGLTNNVHSARFEPTVTGTPGTHFADPFFDLQGTGYCRIELNDMSEPKSWDKDLGAGTRTNDSKFTLSSATDYSEYLYPGARIAVTVSGTTYECTVANSAHSGNTAVTIYEQFITTNPSAVLVPLIKVKSTQDPEIFFGNADVAGVTDGQVRATNRLMQSINRGSLAIAALSANYPALILAPGASSNDKVMTVKNVSGAEVGWIDGNGTFYGVEHQSDYMILTDGVGAPGTTAGEAKLYVDTADGDLKVKFGDGTVKTIVTDT